MVNKLSKMPNAMQTFIFGDIESVRSLHDINQRQNKQATKVETELVQLREDKANLQMGLDRAWQELAEARKASAELSSQTHAAALEREMKMNEDLHEQLDTLKAQHAAVESNLRQDIQELRVSLSNREELAGEKEDQLYMEIRSLQARLEQSDHDSYELQETLDEARRPLLRQIEILQNQQGVANRNWDKVEKSLTRRITEAEENTAKAQERERAARDKLDEVVRPASLISVLMVLVHCIYFGSNPHIAPIRESAYTNIEITNHCSGSAPGDVEDCRHTTAV